MRSPDRWERLQVLFTELVDLSMTELDARLLQICPDDAELREQVAAMVRHDRQSDGRIALAVENVLLDLIGTLESPDEGQHS